MRCGPGAVKHIREIFCDRVEVNARDVRGVDDHHDRARLAHLLSPMMTNRRSVRFKA